MYYEEMPFDDRYLYGGSVHNVGVTEYPNDGMNGCGGSYRGYRSLSQRSPPSHYSQYGNDFIPSRRTMYMNMLGSICEEEDGTIPYDLNGTGTKFSMNGMGREFVRSSPPSGNMHSYYPSQRNFVKVKYEEYLDGVSDLMPVGQLEQFNDEEDKETINERKRKFEFDEEVNEFDIPTNWKLPASKSPIMEAMAFCAIQKWGIEISLCQDQTDDSPAKVVFKVLDFEKYYKYSCSICSKQNPTEDLGSRVKSLRRWFVNFPKKRDRRENPQFTLEVKPDVAKKVY